MKAAWGATSDRAEGPSHGARKLVVLISLLVALLLAAGFSLMVMSDRNNREAHGRQQRLEATMLAAGAAAALHTNDGRSARGIIDAVRADPDVRIVGLYDAAGMLVAGAGRNATQPARTLSENGAPGSGELRIVTPVMRGEARIGSLYLVTTVEPASRRTVRVMMVGLLLGLALLVIAVMLISQRVLARANRELADRARSLGEGNDRLQLQIEEQMRVEEEARQAQKMRALGELTGGIAHDFNNMLTVIQGSADILRRPELAEEKRLRFAGAIVETTERAAALTRQLLAFARRQPLSPVPLDLNARIRAMVPLLDPLIGETVRIQLDLGEGLHAVLTDPGQLETAMLNIVANARDAMPDGGTVRIRTRKLDDRPAVELVIADNGTGIDPLIRNRVFEPFFTTKAVGKGTGLGLSQVYGFVNQTGGEVHIAGEPGQGTRIVMILPSTDATPETGAGTAEPAGPRAIGRVLLVEDNPQVGAFAETLLGELGHQVVRANNGIEALALTDQGENYDLVFSDVVMPGMTGLELAGELRRRRPDLPIILTTGYSDRIAAAGAQGHSIIPKPYRLETISEAIENALVNRRAASA